MDLTNSMTCFLFICQCCVSKNMSEHQWSTIMNILTVPVDM